MGVTNFELPDCLMRAIRLMAKDKDCPPLQAYEAAVLISFGYALWGQQEQLDPTKFAMPDEQWGQICQYLMDVKDSDIDRVNYGLSWMNQGPAGYQPEKQVPA
jgi:hypothetical protein